MEIERNICFTRACGPCEISQLPTEPARIAGAQGVDYILKKASFVRPFHSEMETLAAMAAEEYGVQDAQFEIEAAATRAIDKNCSSRAQQYLER